MFPTIQRSNSGEDDGGEQGRADIIKERFGGKSWAQIFRDLIYSGHLDHSSSHLLVKHHINQSSVILNISSKNKSCKVF